MMTVIAKIGIIKEVLGLFVRSRIFVLIDLLRILVALFEIAIKFCTIFHNILNSIRTKTNRSDFIS